MNVEQHNDKAQLILDNTEHLYNRQQAIYKVYLLTGEHENFTRQLIDLAQNVVIATNISETADPFMAGATFDLVQANTYKYMIEQYYDEFIEWNHVVDGKVVIK